MRGHRRPIQRDYRGHPQSLRALLFDESRCCWVGRKFCWRSRVRSHFQKKNGASPPLPTNGTLALEDVKQLPPEVTKHLTIAKALPPEYAKVAELPKNDVQLVIRERHPDRANIVFLPFAMAVDVVQAARRSGLSNRTRTQRARQLKWWPACLHAAHFSPGSLRRFLIAVSRNFIPPVC